MATETLKIIIKAIDQASGAMKKIGVSADSMGKTMQRVGKSMTRSLTLPILAIGAVAVKTYADFDKTLTNFEARTGATAKEMETVRKAAIEMGRDTAFSATQAAEAMLELVTSGSTVEESLLVVTDVLDLAAAGTLRLGNAADIVTDIMNQFQLGVEDSTEVVNILTQASGSSSATIQDMADAFVNAGVNANVFGVNARDTAAALAVMAEAGIKGSDAGTQLSSIISNITRQTPKAIEAWNMLGTSWKDAQGNILPLDDIIKNIVRGMEGMSQAEKLLIIQDLAGQFGKKGLAALIAAGGISEMNEKMVEAATANEVAAKQMESFSGAVNQLKGSLQTLAIVVIGPFVENILQPLVVFLTKAVNAFTNLPGPIQQIAVAFLALLAAAGPVLWIVGKIMMSWGALTTIFSFTMGLIPGLSAGFGILTGGLSAVAAASWAVILPWAAVVAAGVALGVAIWWLANNWDKATAFFNSIIEKFIQNWINLGDMFEFIHDRMAKGWEKVQGIWEDFKRGVEIVGERIGKLLPDLMNNFTNFFEGLWELIKAVVGNVFDLAASVPKAIFELVKASLNAIIETVKDFIVKMVKAAIDMASKAVNAVKDVLGISSSSKVMAEIGHNAGASFAQGYADAAIAGVNQANKQINTVMQQAGGRGRGGGGMTSSIIRALTSTAGGLTRSIGSPIAAVRQQGKRGIGDLLNVLKTGQVSTHLQRLGQEAAASIQAMQAIRAQALQQGVTIGDSLIQGVMQSLGIASASKVMAGIGQDITTGLAQGITAPTTGRGGGAVIVQHQENHFHLPPGTPAEHVREVSRLIAKNTVRTRGGSARSNV